MSKLHTFKVTVDRTVHQTRSFEVEVPVQDPDNLLSEEFDLITEKALEEAYDHDWGSSTTKSADYEVDTVDS